MSFQSIPILPAANVQESLLWWTDLCGFHETFRDTTPPTYAGLACDGAHLHLAAVAGDVLARAMGDQTMVRFLVDDIDALYAAYRQRGGIVHPNGTLQTKPWGTREFSAVDPNGICVTFQSDT